MKQNEDERAQKDLRLAREIQMSAMPQVFPAYPGRPEFDIYAKMVSADEVGGDFYDFYFAGEERLAILIADVSDRGIPSALFMMRAKTLLKSLIESGLPPAEVFKSANDSLCQGNETGMLLSAWLGIVDLKKGSVTYANAGHKPPVLLKEFGEAQRLSESKNCMMGGFPNQLLMFGTPEQAGAQDPAYLRCPTPEDYNKILEKGGDILKRWSFAPELDGAPAFAAALKVNYEIVIL